MKFASAMDHALAELTLPSPGAQVTPEDCKNLALIIARRGLGQVAPNPLVGAVIVDRDHRFVSAGAHEQVGSAHAEVNAIASARKAGLESQLAGGTLYVTLEPCAHANRTPACAPQVAASGIRRVVYGLIDPNPRVNGRGAALLGEAGVACDHDAQWQVPCATLAEIFLWNIRHTAPYVGLKVATGLDGILAQAGDRRAWITGARARAYGHYLRVYYDAVVVGRGTLLADDPRLDPRDSLWRGRIPYRVVLDPNGSGLLARPDGSWQVLKAEPERVFWLTGPHLSQAATAARDALVSRGVRALTLATDQHGMFSPAVILACLYSAGITSLLLEGGLGVYTAFLRTLSVNKLYLFQAPKLLGGRDSLYFGTAAFNTALLNASITPLNDDWLIEADLHQ